MKASFYSILALIALSGCAAKPDPIPRYPNLDADASLKVIRERLAGLKSVWGEATIVLTDAKKQSVRLDAAFALRPPDRARLRAWKFGQAVFDLTLREDGAWAYLPRDEAKPAAPNLRQSLGRWLSLIADGSLFVGPVGEQGGAFTITRSQPDGATLVCTVDRSTLTPRQYALFDDGGVERFTLTLSNYRPYADGQIWPTLIVARSEQGTFEVRTTEVEVNAELPSATFKPPARAEKLP